MIPENAEPGRKFLEVAAAVGRRLWWKRLNTETGALTEMLKSVSTSGKQKRGSLTFCSIGDLRQNIADSDYGQISKITVLPVTGDWNLRANPKNRHFARNPALMRGPDSRQIQSRHCIWQKSGPVTKNPRHHSARISNHYSVVVAERSAPHLHTLS